MSEWVDGYKKGIIATRPPSPEQIEYEELSAVTWDQFKHWTLAQKIEHITRWGKLEAFRCKQETEIDRQLEYWRTTHAEG
jgi:hypothetical protein